MNIEWKSCIKAAVTVLILFFIIHYWDLFIRLICLIFTAALPLFLGLAMAYVINILMSFFERYFIIICKGAVIQRWKRPICLSFAFLSLLLIIVILWQMLIPALIQCVETFAMMLPEKLDYCVCWLQDHWEYSGTMLERTGYLRNGRMDWDGVIDSCTELLFQNSGWTMEYIIRFLTKFITDMVTLILGVVFAVYLLMRKERLKEDIKYLLNIFMGERTVGGIFYVFHVLNDAFHNFIVGQCIEAVILGALCIVGMLIFQFPYATMIGSLVGFTALIPMAGAYIGAIVGGIMIFTVSPMKAILFLIFLAALQQLENNLIYPRVVGSSIGLPGIWVLAAVIVGGGVYGIPGMIIAVPLTAAAYQIFRETLWKKEEE